MRPSVKKLLLFGTTAPYAGAMLALDFVGSRSAGTPYYMLNGVRYPTVTAVPGWTYTGGASTGSYAPKADGSLQFFPQNVPRITDAGYLAEEARTNLLLRSQEFDNASWVKTSSSVSANGDTAPDGTITADLWTRSATVAYFAQGVAKAASAITYTQSTYVKRSVGNYFALRMQGTYPARADVVFNLSTGAISSAATAFSGFTSASATIAPASNGFYLVTLAATTDAVTSVTGFYSFNSNGVVVDGTDSVTNSAGYIWQADLQAGAFATSPIPTTSVAVTRAADVGYISGLTVPMSAVTMLTNSVIGPAMSNAGRVANLSDGTNNMMATAFGGTNQGSVVAQGVTLAAISSAQTAGQIGRVAMKLEGTAVTASGIGEAATSVAGTYSGAATASRLYIGNTTAADRPSNTAIRRIVIYPRAMSNAELQAITTAGAY